MFKVLKSRLKQGYQTSQFPAVAPKLSERFNGLPTIQQEQCQADCERCLKVCPTNCIAKEDGKVSIDLGKCIFCGNCAAGCPAQAISLTREYRMSVSKREDLQLQGDDLKLATALTGKMHSLFKRSLKLRQVSAGGCNACEADTNVLNTLAWDLGRFGIQFVASPRHADGLLVTGPVTKNMAEALMTTYAAVPSPKIVIATGACAISGGLFHDLPDTHCGVDELLPVDLYIPGCPPHPGTILDGLLRLLDKIETERR